MCNIIIIFTVIFDPFNVFLLNNSLQVLNDMTVCK